MVRNADGRRLYREGYDDNCPSSKDGCPIEHGGLEGCIDCRYVYLVLGRMFEHGKHVFRGVSADEILENIAKTLTAQRTERLLKGRCNDIYLQDGEAPYDDLGPVETSEEDFD
jgi:hypothetical protein